MASLKGADREGKGGGVKRSNIPFSQVHYAEIMLLICRRQKKLPPHLFLSKIHFTSQEEEEEKIIKKRALKIAQ